MVTKMMARKIDKLDIPSIPEFVQMIADTGAGLYACQASADLFGYPSDDFVSSVKDVITVGEFYAMAAGGEIVFT
jgi:peroxiredoxin family protein